MVDKSAFAGPSVTYIARRAMPALARYRGPCHSRSIAEIAVTLVPFVALWTAAWVAVHLGRWELSLLLGIPAAGLLVRLFMIQHDCGHGSFFRHRSANDWVGRFLGILTLTPYDDWRRAHAIHHAASGHLDQRGVGDISTLTVREFQALATWGRLRYRLYRHPFVMFGLGAAYQFLLRHRLPTGPIRGGWQARSATFAGKVSVEFASRAGRGCQGAARCGSPLTDQTASQPGSTRARQTGPTGGCIKSRLRLTRSCLAWDDNRSSQPPPPQEFFGSRRYHSEYATAIRLRNSVYLAVPEGLQ